MKVVLSTIGKFHTFDLARQLHARGALSAVFTGYPSFKLRNEGLPASMIRSFAWVHGPYMGFPQLHKLGAGFIREMEFFDKITFDRYSAMRLPACDVFVGLSGSALLTGRKVRQRGGRYVCDRGSTHIRAQDALLRAEHAEWGVPWSGVDPRVIAREEAEYAEADLITVPSHFNRETFLAHGVPADKLAVLPYGVDLSRFQPVGSPDPQTFDVLFVGGMSLRKGVQYLVQAWRQLQHPRKSLTFVGSPAPELIALLRQRGLWPEEARVLGHMPQSQLKEVMSRSHVMVLPSIEEGLALVQAQSMACGCPVIATTHTGSEDLFTDGAEGFIVPPRDADALAARLQRLADDKVLRDAMSQAALSKVRSIGGWDAYGVRAGDLYEGLVRQ
ncbi:MAG: glycosyltransferase family 4 protein [Rhodocyclaceae bacterium]